MTNPDLEHKQPKTPRQRWSDEKRSSYRKVWRPIQKGGLVFVLVEIAIFYVDGVALRLPEIPTATMVILIMGIYLWFFLHWFRRLRSWYKEWELLWPTGAPTVRSLKAH